MSDVERTVTRGPHPATSFTVPARNRRVRWVGVCDTLT
jgi:hypothetical protein